MLVVVLLLSGLPIQYSMTVTILQLLSITSVYHVASMLANVYAPNYTPLISFVSPPFPCREFEVPSLNFSGQVHKWKLSQFLQKGTDCTYDTLLCDLALSARFIVVTARARIVGHFFSVKNAAKSLVIGLLKICNALVGLPSLLAQDLDHKLIEERCRFLVAELECRVSRNSYLSNSRSTYNISSNCSRASRTTWTR